MEDQSKPLHAEACFDTRREYGFIRATRSFALRRNITLRWSGSLP